MLLTERHHHHHHHHHHHQAPAQFSMFSKFGDFFIPSPSLPCMRTSYMKAPFSERICDQTRVSDRSIDCFPRGTFCPLLLLLPANPSLFHKLPRRREERRELQEVIRSRDGTINIRQRGNLPPEESPPTTFRVSLLPSSEQLGIETRHVGSVKLASQCEDCFLSNKSWARMDFQE